MAKEIEIKDISNILEETKEQYRCEYCFRVFKHKPISAVLIPTLNYIPSKEYPAFQLCSFECLEKLKKEGWHEYTFLNDTKEQKKEVELK